MMPELDFGGTKLWSFRAGHVPVPRAPLPDGPTLVKSLEKSSVVRRGPSQFIDWREAEHRTVGFSGGKDSTALVCELSRLGIPFVAIYADTGWEVRGHLMYYANKPHSVVIDKDGGNVILEYARWVARYLGFTLIVVERPGGMIQAIKSKENGGDGKGMPRVGLQKFCSRELKVVPKLDWMRAVVDSDDLSGFVDMIGIRSEESPHRALQPVTEVVNFGLNLVRPIHHWKVDDVLAAHHRMGVPVNPVYRLGLDRVGCWPCVHASKNEIATIARLDPDRIALIHELEEEVASYRPLGSKRGSIGKNRSKKKLPTEQVKAREAKAASFGAKGPTFFSIDRTFAPIREVVAWSRTSRGGKQLSILADVEAEGGCFRWGMCDSPKRDTE